MAGSKNLGKVGMTTGGEYSSSATYKKLTIVKHNGSQWISKTDVPSGNAPSADSTYWQLMHGTTDLKVLMTGDTASLDPNKVYVWEEAVTNLTITALNGGKEGRRNRYVFQFKNPKTAYTVLTLPSGVLWSSDTELDDNGVPVLDRDGCTRVEIVDNLATTKRWPSIYIIFEDPNVEAVLMSKGVSSDGIGITRKDAREVSTIGTWFKGNTNIETFDEFKYFIGVTRIGYNNDTTAAFMNCTNLRKISLPKSITYIGVSCFNSCNLQEVPDLSMASYIIRARAFNNNPNMRGKVVLNATELDAQIFYNTGIDEVVINNAINIATGANNATTGAFGQCLNLKKVTMGDSVQIIGMSCFYGCISLSEVNFPEGLKEIRSAAFDGCTALEFDELAFPNVTTVGSNAFKGVKIRKLSLPKATSILGANASVTLGDKTVLQELELSPDMTVANTYLLDGYSALTSLSGLVWENLTSLGTSAFAFVKCLPEVINASSVTTVGGGTFRETNITSMVLNACTSVGNTAFYRCASLTTFIIGDACTSIGQQTFAYCTAIQAFICKATTPPSLHGQAFLGVNMTTAPIIFYVPDASVEAYKTATNWLNYATRIKGISDLQTDNPTLYAEIQDYL